MTRGHQDTFIFIQNRFSLLNDKNFAIQQIKIYFLNIVVTNNFLGKNVVQYYRKEGLQATFLWNNYRVLCPAESRFAFITLTVIKIFCWYLHKPV